MTRPVLRKIPLSAVLPLRPGSLNATMRRDQWDALLEALYQSGAVLLEVDEQERPVAAYQLGTPRVERTC